MPIVRDRQLDSEASQSSASTSKIEEKREKGKKRGKITVEPRKRQVIYKPMSIQRAKHQVLSIQCPFPMPVPRPMSNTQRRKQQSNKKRPNTFSYKSSSS
jgi:hypothetical protein